MKSYTDKDLILICHSLECCDYAMIHLNKMTEKIKSGVDVQAIASNAFFIKRTFLVKGFLVNFGQVLSFFYEKKDEDLFNQMKSTESQRKVFYGSIRGIAAHVGDFDEHIEGVKTLMGGSDGINWFMEFEIVKKYVRLLIENNSNKEAARHVLDGWDFFVQSELSQ